MNRTIVKGKCTPLAIGSFPYLSTDNALKNIFDYFKDIPVWPQLPLVDPQEQMYIQYFEAMSGIFYDKEKEKLTAKELDDKFFEEMANIFEHSMAEDYDFFAISKEKARGLHAFIDMSETIKKLNPKWIKGQITGPISFSLTITDQNLKPVLYDESYREMIREVLKMKALWQVKLLKKIHRDVIIFIDEPYLASFGSSMVALSRENAVSLIKSITDSLREKEALSGIHCCGNTDWSILIDANCDIINLDAYEYGENLLLYKDETTDFIKKGGSIAWGIVPTSKAADIETPQNLIGKIEKYIDKLENEQISRKTILNQSFITPACGLGNVPKDRAKKIMEMVREISDILVKKYQL